MKFHLLLLGAFMALPSGAAELPVLSGLVLRLDVPTQTSARQSNSLPSLASQQPVDFLFNLAGRGNRVEQLIAERRPLLVSDGEVAYLKFDGKDDFLAISGPRHTASNLTVFVLAAPKTNAGNFAGLFSTAALGQNDYTSGLNLDFGPGATKQLSVINVESAGASGFQDLLVQMLVPGFVVQELPVKIGNLNNVRYRHDGKLVGLGYDGRIFLLTDTDDDGLEDKAEFFLGSTDDARPGRNGADRSRRSARRWRVRQKQGQSLALHRS